MVLDGHVPISLTPWGLDRTWPWSTNVPYIFLNHTSQPIARAWGLRGGQDDGDDALSLGQGGRGVPVRTVGRTACCVGEA